MTRWNVLGMLEEGQGLFWSEHACYYRADAV